MCCVRLRSATVISCAPLLNGGVESQRVGGVQQRIVRELGVLFGRQRPNAVLRPRPAPLFYAATDIDRRSAANRRTEGSGDCC